MHGVGPAPVTMNPKITFALELPRNPASVPLTRHLVRSALHGTGVTATVVFDVEIAVSEACTNALVHAEPSESYAVDVEIEDHICEIRITDTGAGFVQGIARRPRDHIDGESGRGLLLMQAVMDKVNLDSIPNQGTRITLAKALAFDEESPAALALQQ